MQTDHRSRARLRRSRVVLAIGIAALTLATFVGATMAKGDGLVRVDPPIDLGAAPGTAIEIRFESFQPTEDGHELPWTGTPMVIRLFPVDPSAPMERVRATEEPAFSGRYVATITVPDSGLARVEIGLVGESCVNGVCTISDLPFTLTEGSVVAPARSVAPAGADAVGQSNKGPTVPAIAPSTPPALPVGGLAVVLLFGVVAAAFGSRRLRPGPPSRPPTPDR